MHVVQLQLTAPDQAEAIAEVALTRSDRFHLGAEQLDPGFEGFENLVLVACETVVGQEPVGGITLGFAPLPAGPLCHRPTPGSTITLRP